MAELVEWRPRTDLDSHQDNFLRIKRTQSGYQNNGRNSLNVLEVFLIEREQNCHLEGKIVLFAAVGVGLVDLCAVCGHKRYSTQCKPKDIEAFVSAPA